MKSSENIISEQELEIVFLGTNFGGVDHRKLLEASVLKKAMGYHCGWTITRIMERMHLVSPTGNVLKRGKEPLRTVPELHEFLLRSG